MGRERIAMDHQALLSLLGEVDWVVLATLDEGGAPVGELCRCALEGETLFFATPRVGEAAQNIERDPRVCCSVDTYPTYYEIKGASIHGSARPAPDRPGLGTLGDGTFSLSLDDVVSFDFAKIANKY